MNPDALLRELEGLTHKRRIERMIDVGRRVGEDATVRDTLAALARGGFYERYLALYACCGSPGALWAAEQVLRATADPSRGIRCTALRLAPHLCSDEQALLALRGAPRRKLAPLLQRLARRKRWKPVDTCLDEMAAAGDSRMPALLAFGSPGVVARHLGPVLDRASAADLRRLAARHPGLLTEALRARIAAALQRDSRLLWQVNAVLPRLGDAEPEHALALVRALAGARDSKSLAGLDRPPDGEADGRYSLAELELRSLAVRRPAEMADLLLASADRPTVYLNTVAHRLDQARLRALLERGGDGLLDPRFWLRRLRPEERAELFQAYQFGWRNPDGWLDADIVGLLPLPFRIEEARRHLALPALATRPMQRLRYASFLPWEEARAVLDPAVRSPDPELRKAGIAALIEAARYQRDRLGDVLAAVRARKNEQDPLRLVMLMGLAALPPGAWREEHLADLGQVLRDALDAADLSYATASAAEQMVVRLLPGYPAWAAPWLATLVKERGQVNLHGLGDRLTDADVVRITPALLPVLRAWETRERESQLVAAAASLGRRLRVFPELVEMLEQMLRRTKHSWTAAQVLALFQQHRPNRFQTLVPALIREDRSWVTQAPVYLYLHRHRQDLITPFLGQEAYRGRFSTGRTRIVLPFCGGFHRWAPAQQATFAETLSHVAGDSARDTLAVQSTVAQLAAMPAIQPTRLLELAHDTRLAVRDAALRALGRLDAGQGIPSLIEALADDRARVAIYALRTAILEMPPDRAVALLRGVPVERVTVAKEVARLLGELPVDAAYAELLRLDALELHRDVRVALIRAFWGHLEREETWPILRRAALSPDPAVAAIAGRTAADRLSPPAQGRLAALVASVLAHPDPEVRLDALDRCRMLPVADAERTLMQPVLAAFASPHPDERAAAAQAGVALYGASDAAALAEVYGRIIPDRAALQTACGCLLAQAACQRGHLLEAVRAVVLRLNADPLTAALRAEMAGRVLPWPELADLLEDLAARDELHAEALMRAIGAVSQVGTRTDAAEVGVLEDRLAESADPRLRRIALAALIGLARPPRGWTPDRRERLEHYRADPSALVAAAAQFTFPPPEEPRNSTQRDAD